MYYNIHTIAYTAQGGLVTARTPEAKHQNIVESET